jgi:hypothetical protein
VLLHLVLYGELRLILNMVGETVFLKTLNIKTEGSNTRI